MSINVSIGSTFEIPFEVRLSTVSKCRETRKIPVVVVERNFTYVDDRFQRPSFSARLQRDVHNPVVCTNYIRLYGTDVKRFVFRT